MREDNPRTFASLDGLDVSPIAAVDVAARAPDDVVVPRAPIMPKIASDEATVSIVDRITRRAIASMPTPLEVDFSRELAAEIRRQAIESARTDPSPPGRAADVDTQRRRAARPTKSRFVPAIVGAAACVLVGLGAVAFIREVSTARPPAVKVSATTVAAPTEPKRPASSTPPPPPVPSAAPSASAGLHDLPQFRTRPARTALDRAAKGLSACTTGPKSLWGTGGALVHFDNDGKVSEISLGPPFRTAPEGTCVLAALRDADMGPFVGPSFAISYEFMVPRRTSTLRPK